VLQFMQPDFTALVARTLADTGLPACQLELEVTESIIMEESQYVVATLHELRAQGVQLAIDDFGTGYSSLSYLRRLAVGRLKVDQSFVRGIADSGDDAAITAAIIGMARSLRLRVIAEGVETLAQAEFLRRNGCEEAQGFLFSKPLPAAAATAVLAAGGSCLYDVSGRS
jgi:EAL domain-containing protein (putative c-di-GMP-specific phosphodiesterase class I)